MFGSAARPRHRQLDGSWLRVLLPFPLTPSSFRNYVGPRTRPLSSFLLPAFSVTELTLRFPCSVSFALGVWQPLWVEQAPEDFVKVLSSDGFVFIVKREVAVASGTLERSLDPEGEFLSGLLWVVFGEGRGSRLAGGRWGGGGRPLGWTTFPSSCRKAEDDKYRTLFLL